MIINNRILQIIGNNCKHLEKFVLKGNLFYDLNEKQIKVFGQKCGKDFKYIDFSLTNNEYNNKFVETLIQLTPNIEVFHYNNLSVINSKPNNFYSKLKGIDLFDYLREENFKITFEELKTFADNYHKQINQIDIEFDFLDNVRIDPFLQLSRFESLEKLVLNLKNDKNINTSIVKGLVMIAINCKKLKNFSFEAELKSESIFESLNKRLFKIIAEFQALISCEITIEYEQKRLNIEGISCGYLKVNQNLKHLVLNIPQLNDKHFKNINTLFPQLKTLKIHSKDSLISDKTMHCLAKMPKLSVIDLIFHEPSLEAEEEMEEETDEKTKLISDEGVCDILKNCLDLKRFKLINRSSEITSKTIDALMSTKINPKIEYNFKFRDNINGRLRDYIEDIETFLPQNFKVICFE
jgi:hypothetical protein